MGSCVNCGASRTNEADRFCRSCGTPYAQSSPDPTAPITPVGAAPTESVAAYPPPGTPPLPGATAVRRGPRLGLILAAAGVALALVVTGIVLWQVLKPRGGAETPEAAVEELVLAAAEQDPIAGVDLVNPPEVDQLEGLIASALERGEDADLVEDGGFGDALTIELTDLEFDVEELGEDMAWVTLEDGHYDIDFDPDALPSGFDEIDDLEAFSESGDIAEEIAGEDEISLMTIRTDGRWYVTLVGTMAHYSYLATSQFIDVDEPDWDAASEDVEPVVGEEPEAAITNVLDAVNSGNLDEVLATLPQGLVRPLRPYAPLVQDLLESDDTEFDLSASDMELAEEDAAGDLVKVVIEQGTFEGAVTEDGDSDEVGLTIDGECFEWEGDHSQDAACLSDLGPFSDLIGDEVYLMMRQVDGGYQIDPVATMNAYLQTVIEEFDSQMFEEFFAELVEDL